MSRSGDVEGISNPGELIPIDLPHWDLHVQLDCLADNRGTGASCQEEK